jgi:GNAT superfamily N-acetyltransferase
VNTDVRVRQATTSDLAALCAARNTEALFRQYLYECDGERAFFLVAELEGQLVGSGVLYLQATLSGKRKSLLPKLSDLHVKEGCRRRGVGTALVLAREQIARQHGHAELHVSIDPHDSPGMVALARKLSYVALQTEPYPAVAMHHDVTGLVSEKRYLRLDFRKSL